MAEDYCGLGTFHACDACCEMFSDEQLADSDDGERLCVECANELESLERQEQEGAV